MLTSIALAVALQNAVPAVESYKLHFTLDIPKQALAAEGEMRVKNDSGQPMAVVPLLLYRLMDVASVADASGKPLVFVQKVVKFPDQPAWQVNSIVITLPAPLAPAASTTIRLAYGGPLLGIREVMQYVKDTVGEDYTLVRAETMAYPMIRPTAPSGGNSFMSPIL